MVVLESIKGRKTVAEAAELVGKYPLHANKIGDGKGIYWKGVLIYSAVGR